MLKKLEPTLEVPLKVDGDEALFVARPTDLIEIARVRAAVQAAWYRWQATEFYKRLMANLDGDGGTEDLVLDVPAEDHEAWEMWRAVGIEETVAQVTGYRAKGDVPDIKDIRGALKLDPRYRDALIKLRTVLFMGGEYAPESE